MYDAAGFAFTHSLSDLLVMRTQPSSFTKPPRLLLILRSTTTSTTSTTKMQAQSFPSLEIPPKLQIIIYEHILPTTNRRTIAATSTKQESSIKKNHKIAVHQYTSHQQAYPRRSYTHPPNAARRTKKDPSPLQSSLGRSNIRRDRALP
jgi:hypothetical protein